MAQAETGGLGPGETVTTTDKWVVVWFPPDVQQREHGFASELSARRFAAKDDIAAWAPLLDHRITTTMTVSELVPLERGTWEQVTRAGNESHRDVRSGSREGVTRDLVQCRPAVRGDGGRLSNGALRHGTIISMPVFGRNEKAEDAHLRRQCSDHFKLRTFIRWT